MRGNVMRRLYMVLLTILLFASWIRPLLGSESDAQTVDWAKRYNGPPNLYDTPTAIALDAGGNVSIFRGKSPCSLF